MRPQAKFRKMWQINIQDTLWNAVTVGYENADDAHWKCNHEHNWQLSQYIHTKNTDTQFHLFINIIMFTVNK